ncbi:MAG: hypothetical protein JXC32_02995 [Anaerolineae bacterium]|nr:hypothetical protein [Anaerolineae bacterium]
MNTTELMQMALDLVGFETVPEDSAIYVPGEDIRRVLFGLDIGTAELLMAGSLGYDAVIAHHPVGLPHRAWRVFERHVPLLTGAGVPEAAARAAIASKLVTLRLNGMVTNYEQVPLAARRLGMPFMNVHAPLDELGRRVMQSAVDVLLLSAPDATLRDVTTVLGMLPAAQRAAVPIEVLLGDPNARAGRVLVCHGAYTNGGDGVARACFEHGIDTVVYIHIAPGDLESLRRDGRGQLIVTGHILGDAFGISPYISALRSHGVEVDVLSDILA